MEREKRGGNLKREPIKKKLYNKKGDRLTIQQLLHPFKHIVSPQTLVAPPSSQVLFMFEVQK